MFITTFILVSIAFNDVFNDIFNDVFNDVDVHHGDAQVISICTMSMQDMDKMMGAFVTLS